jgi:predicted transcriptional regulator
MAFNPYFPVGYQPQMYQNQYIPQNQQSGGLIWVQGESGAKSYPVSAGQSALLMDSESNRFFIKSADASGMPLPLRIFDYVERKEANRQQESASAAALDTSRFVTHDELEGAVRAILAQNERSTEDGK